MMVPRVIGAATVFTCFDQGPIQNRATEISGRLSSEWPREAAAWDRLQLKSHSHGALNMKCLICGSEAREQPSGGHFVEVDCPGCKYYGMPKLLVVDISTKKQKFHVERTRAYLEMRAENKQSPWITPVDINNHQLFVTSLD